MRNHIKISNKFIFISSCIFSEKVRNLFLLSLVAVASFALCYFSEIYSSYNSIVNLYKKIELDDSVFWANEEDIGDNAIEDYANQLRTFDEIGEVLVNGLRGHELITEDLSKTVCIYNYDFLGVDYPLSIKKGRMPNGPDEIVISESLEDTYSIGEVIKNSIIVDVAFEEGGSAQYIYQEIEVKVVGICYNDALVLAEGFGIDYVLNQIEIFKTIDELEQIHGLSFMYMNKIPVDRSSYGCVGTMFVKPADGFSQEDVMRVMDEVGIPGLKITYDSMMEEYRDYYSRTIKISWVVGAITTFLIFCAIFSGAGLGINSNRRKINICIMSGAKPHEAYLLSLLSYVPAVILGNIIGFILGTYEIRRSIRMSFHLTYESVLLFIGLEILVFIITITPYLIKGEKDLR